MRTALRGTASTIFLLFFGVALLDAIRGHYWIQVLLWIAVGALFVAADIPSHRGTRNITPTR